MDIFKTLGSFFTPETNLDLSQKVMPYLKELIEEFDLEIYDSDSYSITLKEVQYEGFEELPVNKVEIELQENSEYMVRMNNGTTHTDVPLGLINDLIITELKID